MPRGGRTDLPWFSIFPSRRTLYLLDTDVVIDWLTGQRATVDLVDELRRSDVSINVITHAEIREGVMNAPRRRDAQRGYRKFLRSTRMVDVGRHVADRAGDLRAELRRRRLPVEPRAMDLLIAATAIEHRLQLVTRNLRHYEDNPGLRFFRG